MPSFKDLASGSVLMIQRRNQGEEVVTYRQQTDTNVMLRYRRKYGYDIDADIYIYRYEPEYDYQYHAEVYERFMILQLCSAYGIRLLAMIESASTTMKYLGM